MKRFLAILPTLLLVVPAVVSAEAKPAPPACDNVRDLEIQVRARQQLLTDEELAPFNLGVTVHNGLAVIWGPVTSPQLRDKAMKKIENVRGIYKVKCEMYVSSTAGMLPEPGAGQLLPDFPEQSSSAMPDWRTGQLPPMMGKLAVKGISESPPPKLVLLQPPVAATDDDLPTALDKIRKGDERFRVVEYEIKGGAIYLRSTGRPENLMAFARAISHVPGVERVVLQNSSRPR